MPSITVENYLKQICLLEQDLGDPLVPMGQLAQAMGVTPGTATSMAKSLAEAELVDYEPRAGVRLTSRGSKLAMRVLRRHRIVEAFLVEVLKLDWAEVHAEAEELEHAISDKVLERLDALLGHPATDPHGDPIPTAEGDVADKPLVSLSECETNARLRIARVADQDATFLRFVDQHGLQPGAHARVTHKNATADAITVTPDNGAAVTLGAAAAGKILVAID